MFVCKYCNRQLKNSSGLTQHAICCKLNPDRIIKTNSLKNKPGRIQSKETKEKLSKIAKERNLGGYRKGSGRGKSGWYKNFFCDSSWELAYLIYHLDHNIEIKRNYERFEYIFEGKIKNYIPDFIVNNELIEIKGYNSSEWQVKLTTVRNIKVLYKNDIKPYLEYVTSKYGKNFIELYGKVPESGLSERS